ncbi:MAG: hypothetical protein A3H98_02610 [Bacteroidetes bacterium RIFCSPLOWO2_02_FULL_36_8]|nr:MAG: hypothetical protein A3H98_02610 [Bacteroidetes bacterium RIFCSPLOWO2_02_FULL_36_8]OFY71657.1 MAG: hypothetical protein A3G23_00430 [Bacteroidetes bacterium RIFCSPLOWO2_12_FULL_37_12]
MLTLFNLNIMKTKPIFLILYIFLIQHTYAQYSKYEWAKSARGNGFDNGYSCATDAIGNIIVTGYFSSSSITFGTTTLHNVASEDIFIVKYDLNGNVLWAKSAGGISDEIGRSCVVDGGGNIILMGIFKSSSITFGTTTLSNTGDCNLFIVKYDANGNVLWAKSEGGINFDQGNSCSTDANGNIIVTGFFSSPSITFGTITLTNKYAGNWDIFIVKYDPNGNVLWAKSAGGTSGDNSFTCATDTNKNIIVMGQFGSSTITFGSTILTKTDSSITDMFITKFDANGNVLWARNMGGTSYYEGYHCTTDINGNIILMGLFGKSSITFGTTILSNAGYSDVFIVKYDPDGNVLWAKSVGGSKADVGNGCATDAKGNIIITGDFESPTMAFGTKILTTVGYSDMFIGKYDLSGNVLWAKSAGGTSDDRGSSCATDMGGNIIVTGYFNRYSITFGTLTLNNSGYNDIFIAKLKPINIYGSVFNDISNDCNQSSTEIGLFNRNQILNPGNIIVQTNNEGFWYVDNLPSGNYTITADTSGKWKPTCPVTQNFTVVHPDSVTEGPNFGFISTEPCPQPDVSINMPFMRRCFNNQNVYVNACNENIATGALNNAYVLVQLDTLLSLQSSTLTYSDLGDNKYRFDIGNLNPGQCQNFSIACSLSCNAIQGQTLCMSANLFPADSCVFDTIPDINVGTTPCTLPWDKSSLKVEASCVSDTIGGKAVRFVIYNTGEPGGGDMKCHSPVRLYIDGVLTQLDSVKLIGGDSMVYVYSGDGRTYRLEADQHPKHPGNSHPNACIELCGETMFWQPGLITALPNDDADPVVDIYCGVVTGAYDPNDKTGYPTGVDSTRNLYPNQALEYVIRFQNTGTDTAFTVVIRDTLDTDLDIFTVQSGASSHNYSFRLYGQRILEWTFNNILLPDSNKNEPGSHGFVSFKVEQNKNLPNGKKIENSAGIYFDFNAPVITNATLHTVNDGVKKITTGTKVIPIQKSKNNFVKIYPNPIHGLAVIKITGSSITSGTKITCRIYNLLGKEVTQQCNLNRSGDEYIIERGSLKSGVYFYHLTGANFISMNGMMVVE